MIMQNTMVISRLVELLNSVIKKIFKSYFFATKLRYKIFTYFNYVH